jgi:tetratricopeptide (TPR) repeat protein
MPKSDTSTHDPADVILCYCREDGDRVEELARHLVEAGFRPLFNPWELTSANTPVYPLSVDAEAGVLVISAAACENPWICEEFTALLHRGAVRGQRLVPVLLGPVGQDLFWPSGGAVDLQGFRSDSDDRLDHLVARLRSEAQPPSLDERIGTAFVPRRHLHLRIAPREVALTGGALLERSTPPEAATTLGSRFHQFQAMEPQSADPERLRTLGQDLASTFLPPAILRTLDAALADAEISGIRILLGLQIEDREWERLPWEVLRLPGSSQPLALSSVVEIYRHASAPAAAKLATLPGPLRVLVAVASPEDRERQLVLLDMERELARILAALEPMRQEGRAQVRILEYGTLAAIESALREAPCHVLHLSCHAEPGLLLLESADGQPDLVSAERFSAAILASGDLPPLIVLAGCATGVAGRTLVEGGELPGLAQELVRRGAPAVLAMQAYVSDRYAADFAAEFFAGLASSHQPDAMAALAEARRSVEAQRQGMELGRLPPEWPIPSLHAAGPLPPLLAAVEAKPAPSLAPAARQEEFVGRRREMRLLLAALQERELFAVVIRGIGGVGKTALARQVLQRLGESGWLTVVVTGALSPPGVVEAIAESLRRSTSPDWTETTATLLDPAAPTTTKLDCLQREVLPRLDLLVLLDGFDLQLDRDGRLRDPAMTSFLEVLLGSARRARVLITSRLPIRLPEELSQHLLDLHLGPLSPAETRKMFWRLPALRQRSAEDLRRIDEVVGGHPFALQLTSDLLMDTDEALEPALTAAIGKTVSAAAVEDLMAELGPQARKLLTGAAAYRLPVDRNGLALQLGIGVEEVKGSLQLPPAQPAHLMTSLLPEALLYRTAYRGIRWFNGAEELQPLSCAPEEPDTSQRILDGLGMLVPYPSASGRETLYLVHRWLGVFLLESSSQDLRRRAHEHAALFWHWEARRAAFYQPVQALLEARHHYREADLIREAVEVSRWISAQLHLWSEWRWEETLCRETLGWLPDRSGDTAAFQHQLGVIAHELCRYDEAQAWYQRALANSRRLGDQASMAATLHQLAILTQQQGKLRLPTAEELFREVLDLKRSLGDPAPSTLHQLGILAEAQGEFGRARQLYEMALSIEGENGDSAGRARLFHQLGNLELAGGNRDEAERLYAEAASVFEQMGDRASLASSLHQLGLIAQLRGAAETAFDFYQKSLFLEEATGDRASLANTYHQLGHLARETGSFAEALKAYGRALALYDELCHEEGRARTSYQLGVLQHTQKAYPAAEDWYQKAAELFARLGDEDALARALLQLGILLAEQGRDLEAEESLQRAGDAFARAGLPREASRVHLRLGALWLLKAGSAPPRGSPSPLSTVARVLAIARQHRDSVLATGALRVYLANLSGEEVVEGPAVEAEIAKLDPGHPEIAIELAAIRLIQRRYREAADLVSSVVSTENQLAVTTRIQALYTLGEARIAMGTSPGIERIEEGLELARASRQMSLVAEGYLRLGNACLMRQDFEDARLHLLMAASLFQRLRLPAKVALCYRLLILLSGEVGRLKDAEHFRKRAQEYFQGIGHPEWLREIGGELRPQVQ